MDAYSHVGETITTRAVVDRRASKGLFDMPSNPTRKVHFALYFLMLGSVNFNAFAQAEDVASSISKCGSLEASSDALDYRQRTASRFNDWRLKDNNQNHLYPPLRRMQEGEYSRRVRADIEFLLRAWPNHYEGLEALVRYDLAGGSAFDLLQTECLFARAKSYASNDINVLFVEAYYQRKSGRMELALNAYEAALQIDPNSTDANYMMGLLLFELGRFVDSDKHAQIAYEQQYPLPGLKNKLMQAGHWGKSVVLGSNGDGG